ncbi:MAG: cytochrome c-type biogenesis protein CcmH [Myxococcales bacterium]|nr:cytochrome c-type biogenesis protein CcmH [Myxococcales bacterium]
MESGDERQVEKELQQSLIAPCCFRQTLDAHISPMAEELRQEIHQRLSAGQSADAIRQDLTARFGPEVLARPPSGSFGGGLMAFGALLAVAPVAFIIRRRQQRRAPTEAPLDRREPEDTRLADRLEEELDALP